MSIEDVAWCRGRRSAAPPRVFGATRLFTPIFAPRKWKLRLMQHRASSILCPQGSLMRCHWVGGRSSTPPRTSLTRNSVRAVTDAHEAVRQALARPVCGRDEESGIRFSRYAFSFSVHRSHLQSQMCHRGRLGCVNILRTTVWTRVVATRGTMESMVRGRKLHTDGLVETRALRTTRAELPEVSHHKEWRSSRSPRWLCDAPPK